MPGAFASVIAFANNPAIGVPKMKILIKQGGFVAVGESLESCLRAEGAGGTNLVRPERGGLGQDTPP